MRMFYWLVIWAVLGLAGSVASAQMRIDSYKLSIKYIEILDSVWHDAYSSVSISDGVFDFHSNDSGSSQLNNTTLCRFDKQLAGFSIGGGQSLFVEKVFHRTFCFEYDKTAKCIRNLRLDDGFPQDSEGDYYNLKITIDSIHLEQKANEYYAYLSGEQLVTTNIQLSRQKGNVTPHIGKSISYLYSKRDSKAYIELFIRFSKRRKSK